MGPAKSITILLVLLFISNNTYSQNSGRERLKELENALMLDMGETVLEIGLDLITYHDETEYGEKAHFLLGNYFYRKADSTQHKIRAYYIYNNYLNKYPQGNYKEKVSERIREIEYQIQLSGKLNEAYQDFLIDYGSFNKKLEFAKSFTDSMYFDHFSKERSWFGLYNNITGSHATIFDEITNELIAKYERFELRTYDLKIRTIAENLNENFGEVQFENEYLVNLLSRKKQLLELTNTEEVINALHDKLYPKEKYGIDFNDNKQSYTVYLKRNLDSKSTLTISEAIDKIASPEALNENYIKIYLMLSHLSKKYKNDRVINDLHLYLASKFMTKNRAGEFDFITRFHLEYIIQNSNSENSLSYLLATEFIENNSFVTPANIKQNPFLD